MALQLLCTVERTVVNYNYVYNIDTAYMHIYSILCPMKHLCICTYMYIICTLLYTCVPLTIYRVGLQLSPVDVRPFVQPTGLVAESTGEPGDLFALFFTPEIIRSIVAETNKYAALCLQGSSTTWTTDEEEIRAYFVFYILMGLVRLPEIWDYWSNSDTFHYAPIADRISRKQFEEISRYLHCVDKESLPARGAPGHHRLQHIKPIVDALRERFSAVYNPGCHLSVDEAMIPFKGGCKLYKMHSNVKWKMVPVYNNEIQA